MKKVSIIVPIYNAEEYLKKAIDSLVFQTYKNLEIILINDGSTDGTENIIYEYADKRIKYIKKDNTGISDTRNMGLDVATGDYIMFLDSDDYLELDAVEIMLNKCLNNDCDLVVCDYFIDTKSSSEVHLVEFEDCNLEKHPDLITKINMAPWNKIYKRNLFENEKIRFPLGLKYEDAPVVVSTLVSSKKIGKINKSLYHYVIKTTGETITRDERLFDIFNICDLIKETLKSYSYIDETSFIVKILSYYLKTSKYIDDKDLRNSFITHTFNYLYNMDKDFKRCNFIKEMKFYKRFILFNKSILFMYINLYNIIKK